jgi:high affinity sulfate transporter 1
VSEKTQPAQTRPKIKKRLFLMGVIPVPPTGIGPEVIAGTTLAALAIPEVMGYASIAEMPVITGLYTILIPLALYSLLGSSRHLVVGADSATAAVLAAGLTGLAKPESDQWVALAGMVALMAGVMLFLARLLRLGFLADFLSRTVLVGFLTGVGIQVAAGQLAGMLGVPDPSGGTLEKLWDTILEIPDTSMTTLAVSLSVIIIMVGGKRLAPKVPWALIAVVGSMLASYWLDLSAHGVSTLGKVPGGLPSLGWPDVPSSDITDLLGIAASVFFLILAQSAATSRAYAAKNQDLFDENIDLDGLAAANIGAGLSGTFPVNGSPTKTQMIDSAGGHSQISQLTTVAIVAIVLLFLTKPLQYMPNAVLATIVFLIGVELVDIKGLRDILRKRLDEFILAIVTATVVVLVGVEQAIILALILSLLDHIRRGYHPHDAVLAQTDEGHWKSQPIDSGEEATPGLVVYRFGASLYYANAARFQEEILALIQEDRPPVRWLAVDAGMVGDVDYSGGKVIREVQQQLEEQGVKFVMCDIHAEVRAQLDRYGLSDLIEEDLAFDTIADVLQAYAARGESAPAPPAPEPPVQQPPGPDSSG